MNSLNKNSNSKQKLKSLIGSVCHRPRLKILLLMQCDSSQVLSLLYTRACPGKSLSPCGNVSKRLGSINLLEKSHWLSERYRGAICGPLKNLGHLFKECPKSTTSNDSQTHINVSNLGIVNRLSELAVNGLNIRLPL